MLFKVFSSIAGWAVILCFYLTSFPFCCTYTLFLYIYVTPFPWTTIVVISLYFGFGFFFICSIYASSNPLFNYYPKLFIQVTSWPQSIIYVSNLYITKSVLTDSINACNITIPIIVLVNIISNEPTIVR